jgi:hypothetical protein
MDRMRLVDHIGFTRREFIRTGAAVTGLALAGAAPAAVDRRCIFLWLTGGPSHIDTFDPKPDAPAEIRGPFRPIATRVPGFHVTELLPRIAERADLIAFVRSMHHDAVPIHETGQQLLQTGRLHLDGREHPHIGASLSELGYGPWAILPFGIGDTGVDMSHGQSAGPLPGKHGPRFNAGYHLSPEPALSRTTERYGPSRFGRACLRARQHIERDVRLCVVNMFDTVYDGPTWDCHADGAALNTGLDDVRDEVAPAFDAAYSALLDDLSGRGLLSSTLVVAAGEFGRTPRLNPRGGRDHWPGVWTVLLAGAGVRGGAIVGASDNIGAEPADRPVTPAELVATIYHALGVDPRLILPTPGGPQPLADAEPIHEVF